MFGALVERGRRGLLPLLLLLVHAAVQSAARPVFPAQFSAELQVTAHLVDKTQEYPPHLRRIALHYDFPAKRVRADVLAGYEEGRFYLRRYDEVCKLL